MRKLSEEQIQRLRDIYQFLDGNLYRESDGTEVSHMYLPSSFQKWKEEDASPTNLEVFRAYAEAYVMKHPGINKELLGLVRQLEAGPNGIPLQVYAFTTDKTLIVHSQVISDIFSHLIAKAGDFGLEVFESPSGSDLRERLQGARLQSG